MPDIRWLLGLALALGLAIGAGAVALNALEDNSSIVETRTERLVYDGHNCRVYQVVFGNADGNEIIYVTTPHRDSNGRQRAVKSCSVTN